MTRGTLEEKEIHPSARSAIRWIKSLPLTELVMWQESFSSCAIEGNRLAEVCGETLHRLTHNEPVSDRYLLGLAWAMRFNDESAQK